MPIQPQIMKYIIPILIAVLFISVLALTYVTTNLTDKINKTEILAKQNEQNIQGLINFLNWEISQEKLLPIPQQ